MIRGLEGSYKCAIHSFIRDGSPISWQLAIVMLVFQKAFDYFTGMGSPFRHTHLLDTGKLQSLKRVWQWWCSSTMGSRVWVKSE
jgi:hypothetical protein